MTTVIMMPEPTNNGIPRRTPSGVKKILGIQMTGGSFMYSTVGKQALISARWTSFTDEEVGQIKNKAFEKFVSIKKLLEQNWQRQKKQPKFDDDNKASGYEYVVEALNGIWLDPNELVIKFWVC